MPKVKYSYAELAQILNDVQSILNRDEELNTKLAYGLVKNKKAIKAEMENIEESFKDKHEKIEEFQREKTEVLKNNGAKFEQSGQMTYLSNENELDMDKVDKELEKLKKKFKATLAEQKEIDKHNKEKALEEVARVDFFTFPFDYLPEKIPGNLLTENILLFIEDE